MNDMFRTPFCSNQDFGNWSVGNVTTMETMFALNVLFNQNRGD